MASSVISNRWPTVQRSRWRTHHRSAASVFRWKASIRMHPTILQCCSTHFSRQSNLHLQRQQIRTAVTARTAASRCACARVAARPLRIPPALTPQHTSLNGAPGAAAQRMPRSSKRGLCLHRLFTGRDSLTHCIGPTARRFRQPCTLIRF